MTPSSNGDPLTVTDALGVPPVLLRPPTAAAEPVPRSRLSDRIASIGERAIALVVAPAGAGKTTLLAQSYQTLQSRGIDVAWLSLTPLANRFHRFFTQMIAAVRQLHPEFATGVPSWLEGLPPRLYQELALRLSLEFSGFQGRRLVLFLDDYHEVGLSVIHRTLAGLIDHLPPEVSLVIGSRTEPPLQIAELRAGGRLLELGWNELQFSRQEAEQLFHRSNLVVSSEQLDELYRHTEGWVAGLQLTRLNLQSGRPQAAPALTGDQARVADYFLNVVLEQQPAQVRQFLLHTSVLERMSAPLCDAVCERDDSAAVLEELDRQNLFTFRLDEQRLWYRYHHLFSEFLQSRLRQIEPGHAEALCLRASRWFEKQGAYAEALDYALQAGAMEQAAGLLEPYGRDLFRAGSFKELKLSLEQLPDAVLRRHAELCVLHGWASAYAGEFELARQRAADADAAADGAASPAVVRAETTVLLCTLGVIRTDEPRLEVLEDGVDAILKDADSSVRAFAEVALGYADRALGRLPEAAAHLEKAVRLAELGESSLVNMLARYNLSSLALLRGERRYAESMGRGSLDFAERRHWLGTMGTAFVRVQLGVALYEANRLEESLAELDTAIEVLRSTQAFGFLGVAVVIRASVYWALGQQDRVQLDLEWAERIADSYQVARVRIRKLQLQSRMALAATRPGYARRYLEQGLALVGEVDETRLPWPERYEQFEVIGVRLRLAEQDWAGALARAQAVLASAEAAGRHYNRVEALALAAEAQLALGAEPAAEAALREALAIAVPEQLWRPFYHIGPRLPQLLARLAADAGCLARDLLAAMGQAAESPALEEPLHIREQQILELMAAGLQNREIGARLFLSEETVKWYLKRLYRTLDVHNRTAAIAKARELGLIADAVTK